VVIIAFGVFTKTKIINTNKINIAQNKTEFDNNVYGVLLCGNQAHPNPIGV
jgi:hypothetical protein